VAIGLSGCALPPNPSIGAWARQASLAADYPAALPPEAPAMRAAQRVAAQYLFGLGIVANRDGMLEFDPSGLAGQAQTITAADPAAGAAAARLGALLIAARDGNPKPPPQAIGPNFASPPDDTRLETMVRQGDAPLQALLGAIGNGLAVAPPLPAGPRLAAREGYREVLARIGEGHALLLQRVRHLDQQETRRMMRVQEEQLMRTVARLPTATPAAPG